VADITYIATWSGWLYLAVVVDAWSRRVVGWAMANHLRTELVLQALAMGNRYPQFSNFTYIVKGRLKWISTLSKHKMK
jgi:transposase InsO family protein